jgi:hypothetical protein
MNRLERTVYNLVRNNPKLKDSIRNIYQRTYDLLPAPSSQTAYPVTSRPGYFYGFHDHTPFSFDNTKLLACKHSIPLRMPKLGEPLEVGYFDGEDFQNYHPVSETKAWLWHMGCKLQWRGPHNQMVFNDHKDGKNIARVVDLDTNQSRDLTESIASVSPDGKWAVGYSFARVARCMPGYGYHYDVKDPEIEADAPQENGIHIVDMESGNARMLFSIAHLAAIEPEPSMKDALHFVTHAVFNPGSNRFIFLHRWVQRSGQIEKRWSRMFSCGINGDDLYLFPTTDMVSHIGWRGDDYVIAYCRTKQYDDQYVLFRDQVKEELEAVGVGQLNSDGHPSFDPSGRWMITDTYPDRRRLQNLVLFDTHTNKRYNLCKLLMPARYQSPSSYEHWACDLHPRWDRVGRYVCFDSTFTGERSLCTIDLKNDLSTSGPKFVK